MADEENLEPQSAVPEGQEVAVELEKPRGGKTLTEEQLAQRSEVPDDEIARYNEEAQKRIKGLRVAYGEQRRRAEQWSRDASTASNLAEQLYRENQHLRQTAARSEAAMVEQAIGHAEAKLAQASMRAMQAQASQNPESIVAANEDQARAVAEVDRLKLLRPVAGEPVTMPPPAVMPTPSQPPASPRTQAWMAQNPWFNQDEEMTKYAVQQHKHLVIDGITDESNPDLYFRTIDERLRVKFPEKFGGSARPTEGRARPVAVTGGTRTNGAPPPSATGKRTVHLTESQVRLAQRLGLTPEQYAKQMVIDEQEEEKERRMIQ
jgi:hypothetical protein